MRGPKKRKRRARRRATPASRAGLLAYAALWPVEVWASKVPRSSGIYTSRPGSLELLRAYALQPGVVSGAISPPTLALVDYGQDSPYQNPGRPTAPEPPPPGPVSSAIGLLIQGRQAGSDPRQP